MNLGHKIYSALPLGGQNLAVSTYGVYWKWLRFGPGFRKMVHNYNRRERLSTDEWAIWTDMQLRTRLTAAARHVPYYASKWTLTQKRAAADGRLEEIPLLDKAPVRADPRSFLRSDLKPPLALTFPTSGSTGTPVDSIFTPREMRDKLAVREARSARWAGVSFRMPRATFSGRIIVSDAADGPPYYRFNYVEKQVYFSAFHVRPDTARDYVAALRRHSIQWMTGYATSFYLLATFILDQNLQVPPLKALITTSEKLTDDMRRIMEKAYGCPVYEEYSTVENALFVSECECRRLHVSPDVSIIEIIRPDGTPCVPGEIGEVVSTSLVRNYQPFIRYRLGDLACWDAEPCPCGRPLPIIKEVVGRLEDVIVGPDGRRVVRFHGIFVDQPHIQEGQVIQEALDRIRVKIVPTDGFSSVDEQEIIRRLHDRLGPFVQVHVEKVSDIPRTTAGKFKAVVSLLPSESVV